MASLAYYNENDPKAAAWLRELIRHGHIAFGVVDDRSIEDVVPAEIAHFAQCHFFVGIGAWSLALRQGGWPDDRPAWTASLPCQPFSAAGQRGGFADERHLWPVFLHLLTHGKHRTVPVLGEQVANRGGLEWFDLVSADLERAGYAIGAADTCAAGFGAPHLRQRLYWIALADAGSVGRQRRRAGEEGGWGTLTAAERRGDAGGLADAQQGGRQQQPGRGPPGIFQPPGGKRLLQPRDGGAGAGDGDRPGPVNGHWAECDWVYCRDGRWRPVEPIHVEIFNGFAASLGRVRSRNKEARQVDARVSDMRPGDGARDVSLRETGDAIGVLKEDLLFDTVRPEDPRKGTVRGSAPEPDKGTPRDQEPMRGVRRPPRGKEAGSSPQGRRSEEQHRVELDDIVRFMSPSRALASLHGRHEDAEALRLLCEAIEIEGRMHGASGAVEEIWASLGEDAKDGVRVRLGFDASRWRLVVPSPLTRGAPSRVTRLRGYGNSLCVPQAAAFVRAARAALS
jgi:DNA (cytosine-5)-methyltransferase 1